LRPGSEKPRAVKILCPCVFRSKPATHSDVKAATHSGVKAATRSEAKAATCSDVKAATFRPRSEWVAGLPPE